MPHTIKRFSQVNLQHCDLVGISSTVLQHTTRDMNVRLNHTSLYTASFYVPLLNQHDVLQSSCNNFNKNFVIYFIESNGPIT